MLRRLASVGVVSLGVMCMAIRPHEAPPPPPPAKLPPPPVVPTAKKVVNTPRAAPPPGSAAPAPPSAAPSAAPPTAPAPNSVEAARQGVVVLERQGKPLALGMVLEADGRIVSALS